jgi:alpha-mannosidase
MNRLVVYEDPGDAWDIPLDYRTKPPVQMTLIESKASVDGPCAVIVQSYRCGQSVLTQKIILKTDSPVLEFETTADWKEQSRMLRVEFPVNATAREATYEIQFGTIRRPTHNDTSWDKAKEEVAAQQWCDLSQSDCGVSLINDCKYGHRIKGNVIELNLLRSAPYPDLALIEAADRSRDGRRYKHGDREVHRFRYAVYPHQGDAVSARTMNRAREFNQPLRLTDAPSGSRRQPGSLLAVDNPQIDLPAIKKADDGRGFIVRLCNMADRPCETRISSAFVFERLYETNLMEEGEAEVSSPLHFEPFEIKTLRAV